MNIQSHLCLHSLACYHDTDYKLLVLVTAFQYFYIGVELKMIKLIWVVVVYGVLVEVKSFHSLGLVGTVRIQILHNHA